MSIFFDFNVGPNGRRFRRAVDGDKSDIESIINRKYSDCLFGTPDIGSLIELSALSICMINENKEVIGFMALSDHPNIFGVDPADWEVWCRNMFQKFFLSRNTLFIHFMCCIDAVTDIFLDEAFVTVFRNDVYLLNIVIVVPRGCPEDWTSRYKTFKRRNTYKFFAKQQGECDSSLYLRTAMRKDFCPKLKIRRAVEEDNDDIVEMLGKSCQALQELYGNYYVSEIIGRHPGMDRHIIVADYRDQAVGVMCLNSKINYEMLQKTYELGPYHGLRKVSPLEKENYKRSNVLLNTFGMPIMLGKWNPYKVLSKHDFTQLGYERQKQKLPHKRAKGLSRVNFDCQADKSRKRFDDFFYKQTSEDYSEKELMSPSPSMLTNRSVADLLDGDPFDYEIVNIDKVLLSVPEVLPSELISTHVRNTGSRGTRAGEIQSKNKKRSSMLRRATFEEEEFVPYAGEPNAFIIELFGLREDVDDRQSFHLLEVAFEMMKDYDYCVIRVPCKEKSFHLLEHFCVIHKTNSLAVAMIPLIPRKSEVDCMPVPELRRIRELLNTIMPFSAWFINKKLTSVPKVNVNTRIIVVGASRTAMAFLNALLFSDSCTYLFFTNVTLVSPYGLPYARRNRSPSEMMFPKFHTKTDGYLKSSPYTYYVNVVQGTMVEINKRDKYITLSNGGKCCYDLLFLLIGKQYQHPDYLKPILEREKEMRSGNVPKYMRLDIPQQSPEPKIDNCTPSNVFIVNTITDANKALNIVKNLTCHNTESINRSGMAYNDGILIDHEFKTKDSSIYAAGPATKYRRQYYADSMRHEYFDAYEIGTKLGYQIKNQLDPLFKEVKKETQNIKDTKQRFSSGSSETIKTESINTKSDSESSVPLDQDFPKIPVFKKPHVSCCTLPGGLHYLEVRSPGKKIPHQYVQSLKYNGIVLETFKGGYFKLHLTNELIVDGITCLTPENYSLENFKNLYGLSATVLNNVFIRYTAKKIDDFYAFFRAPWACFLYHDQTDELFAMVKELLPKSFKCHTKLKIRSSFEKTPYVEAITDYVIEWLSENDVLLPMYIQPFQTSHYDHDLEHNPAFRNRKSTIVKMMTKIF
ncbi:jg12557 [Pararge aegeria aegeria]|uniref:Jg12557 protein n=1 Tax=Pararge aegeria aegeria TaxID=348720 RepID=A0A8S4SCI4_9NEOP|nr:jg12557 [Pararge aegeria aegeria]